MNLGLWIVVVAVCAMGAVPLAVVARRLATEVTDLRDAIDDLGQLRPALAQVREETAEARRALRSLRLR